MKYQQSFIESIFWDNVYKNTFSGCWEWLGGVSSTGYGRFWDGVRLYYVHRFSYTLDSGEEIPEELYVCHTCDNKLCVNPKHLFLGTQVDNNRDRDNKNRQAKGSKCGNSILTEDKVVEIKKLLLTGQYTQGEIANKFGVGRIAINLINTGKNWKHVYIPEGFL